MSELSRPTPSPLTQTLRAIRHKRGLRACDIARRMGLALRTYEYFEARAERLSCEDLLRFAKAADCDAYALLASAALNHSDLALACVDNKVGEVLTLLLDEFLGELGAAADHLSPQQAQIAFSQAFRRLAHELAQARSLSSAPPSDTAP
ncbi:hypothetical protein [Phenylobacterium aquaticum]|uniref:hypothetical protein n=1 Tax=Phenylobacterium aquaticum TaxID=1763816 RepID=UPI001F5D774F|nr:hypothetical protein [Phenylobacterium aquaticum]MCI3135341.1 hypothetical protein [Phenylobacterium aquaticum]